MLFDSQMFCPINLSPHERLNRSVCTIILSNRFTYNAIMRSLGFEMYTSQFDSLLGQYLFMSELVNWGSCTPHHSSLHLNLLNQFLFSIDF